MRMVPLRKYLTVTGGGTPRRNEPKFWGGPVPWATVKDLKSETLSETQEFITEDGVANSATSIVPRGTVITATRMALGRAAINTVDLAINQDLKALHCNEGLTPRFLLHYINANSSKIEALGKGATVKGITLDDLLSLEVPEYEPDEQKRIAAILDKADGIRRKRQQALALTDQFLQSLFLDMFGDPVTNPKGWDTNLFGDADVGTLDRGRSRHRPRNAPELLGGPHPLIQTGEVANCRRYITEFEQTYSELGLQQSKMWPAGTLCITIAANIAKTGILTFEACFPDSVVGFTPSKDVRTEYVQYWLSFLQKILEDKAPESAQKNINLEILRGLDIPVPDTDLQDEFVKLVKHTESMAEKLDSSFRSSENGFSSLVQRAFKGEL